MTTDLSSYSLPQLKQLSARIAKEITRQEAGVKAATLKKLEKLAREHGLSLKDVVGDVPAASPRKAATTRAKPAQQPASSLRYRHPSNSELAWSGRGRKPQWVEAWLAHGGALEALATAAERFEKRHQRTDTVSRASAPAST